MRPLYFIKLNTLTYNIYGLSCRGTGRLDSSIYRYTKADIIYTQENLKNFEQYFYVPLKGCGLNSNEGVQIYLRQKSESDHMTQFTDKEKNSNIKCYEQIADGRISTRYAISTVIRGVRITNLHLEGGRYSDPMVLDTQFQAVLDHKLNLIKQVIILKML